jgi:hypothetical protein
VARSLWHDGTATLPAGKERDGTATARKEATTLKPAGRQLKPRTISKMTYWGHSARSGLSIPLRNRSSPGRITRL